MKSATRNLYVALLRGINVGGSNLIKMSDLKACLEAAGLRDVTTYIQSGNVLFSASGSSHLALVRQIENSLSAKFAYQSRVVVRSLNQMRTIVDGAPAGFGKRPAAYRYDVIFLKEPLTAAEALKTVTAKPGVDCVFSGDGVLYFSRLISKAAQSRLSRIVGTPAYQSMTIRNWNTTSKLLDLMESLAAGSSTRRRSAP